MVRLDLVFTLATIWLEICSDSQLIVGQIQKMYEAKDECMTHYLTLVEECLGKLDELTVRHVPQTKNSKADALVGIAATLPIRVVVMLSVYL